MLRSVEFGAAASGRPPSPAKRPPLSVKAPSLPLPPPPWSAPKRATTVGVAAAGLAQAVVIDASSGSRSPPLGDPPRRAPSPKPPPPPYAMPWVRSKRSKRCSKSLRTLATSAFKCRISTSRTATASQSWATCTPQAWARWSLISRLGVKSLHPCSANGQATMCSGQSVSKCSCKAPKSNSTPQSGHGNTLHWQLSSWLSSNLQVEKCSQFSFLHVAGW
mmetsp:Transcript_140365/g.448642  ORF Transcript_140365/g.448642 Transcript_140365/m.448642 type:complete len:219 (-) Transcript_140365:1627-2283(-)